MGADVPVKIWHGLTGIFMRAAYLSLAQGTDPPGLPLTAIDGNGSHGGYLLSYITI